MANVFNMFETIFKISILSYRMRCICIYIHIYILYYIVCFAVFDMSVVDRPLYHLLSQNLLLMEVDPGKFTAVVVILSHIVRSWFSSGTVDISVIQGELASFRTEVLRAEHTVRLANQALAECVDTLSVHSWIFRTLGLFICLAIIGYHSGGFSSDIF